MCRYAIKLPYDPMEFADSTIDATVARAYEETMLILARDALVTTRA